MSSNLPEGKALSLAEGRNRTLLDPVPEPVSLSRGSSNLMTAFSGGSSGELLLSPPAQRRVEGPAVSVPAGASPEEEETLVQWKMCEVPVK